MLTENRRPGKPEKRERHEWRVPRGGERPRWSRKERREAEQAYARGVGPFADLLVAQGPPSLVERMVDATLPLARKLMMRQLFPTGAGKPQRPRVTKQEAP